MAIKGYIRNRSKEDSETFTKQLTNYIKSDGCNIESLKTMSIIESLYEKMEVIDERFFLLLSIVEDFDDLRLSNLVMSENEIAKKYINTFNKNGLIPVHEAYQVIHNGLLSIAYTIKQITAEVENFYNSKVEIKRSDNVMVLTIENKYKITLLINLNTIQIISVYNKEKKNIYHYKNKEFKNKHEIIKYLNNYKEYCEYPNEIFEMMDI